MILKTFLIAIAEISHIAIYAYTIVIFIACILSFVRPDPYNKFVQIIYHLSEPVFAFFRRKIPTTFGGLDLSPLIVFFILAFIDKFFVRLLLEFAYSM